MFTPHQGYLLISSSIAHFLNIEPAIMPATQPKAQSIPTQRHVLPCAESCLSFGLDYDHASRLAQTTTVDFGLFLDRAPCDGSSGWPLDAFS